MRSLLSVTYHLPPDFWTSLLLKLCDLAVHTVAQKNTAPRRSSSVCVCVCVRNRGKAAVEILHALYIFRVRSMFVLVHVKAH